MTKSSILTILILALILLAGAYFTYQALHPGENADNSEALRALVGTAEEPATFADLDGNPVNLEQFAGKVRVVNSWATWCPFCVDELPDFEALAKGAGEDVVVIAINRQEPAIKQKSFLEDVGDFESIVFLQDEKDRFYDSIGGFSMPETIFYSQTGAVVVHKRGFMSLPEMKRHLEAARTYTANTQ